MMDKFKEFATFSDTIDSLACYRNAFHFPQHNGKAVRYFTGNSLGLQPKTVKEAIETELETWAKYGVEGHFDGPNPWMHYHKFLTDGAAAVVGALAHEVVVMNTLTVNLHLMLVSFYRPQGARYKILMEAGAFPSDQYAVESQVRFHGYDPIDAIIELSPREGEYILREEDIIASIEKNGHEVALIMMGGVNYYTGQWYPMEAITQIGHKMGCIVGFDLAHAAGNVPLMLHQWQVDFAVWCSYKYLNAGPGGVSGVFVHQKHADNPKLPRFAGWWGHYEEERFQMKKGFIPMYGAAGWQLSNAQILPMAAHKASLAIFQEAGMQQLREKSIKLTGFLFEMLEKLVNERADLAMVIITPKNQTMRGSQISLLVQQNGRLLFEFLSKNGIIADWREPNVIRFAPVPLYNTFDDVYVLAATIAQFKP